jgi:hypothetical protein
MKIFTAILTSLENGFLTQIDYFYINTTTTQGQGLNRGSALRVQRFRVQRFRVLGSTPRLTAGAADLIEIETLTGGVSYEPSRWPEKRPV